MMAGPITSFNGYGDDGLMRFGADDGSIVTTAPTPDAVVRAQQLTAASGADPMTALPPGNPYAPAAPPAQGGGLTGPVDPGLAALVAGQREEQNARKLADNGEVDAPKGHPEDAPGNQGVAPPRIEGSGGGGGASQSEQEPKGNYTPASTTPLVSSPDNPTGTTPDTPPGGAAENPNANKRTGLTLAEQEAALHIEQARRDMQGTPGYMVKGGTNLRGISTQQQVGAAPEAVAAQDAAMKRGEDIASDDERFVSSHHDDLSAAATEEANEKARHAADLKASTEAEQARLAPVFAHLSKLEKELGADKVRPNRLWEDASTGNKILAGIGLFFGGVGGKNGSNAALEQMNRAVDRDIDAQVKNIANKRGELTELQKIFEMTIAAGGTEKQGKAAMHLAALDAIEAKRKRSSAMLEQGRHGAPTHVLVPEVATETWHNEDGTTEERPVQYADGTYAMRMVEVPGGQTESLHHKAFKNANAARRADRMVEMTTAQNGTVGKQYEVTQNRMVGGTRGSPGKAAESMKKAREAMGDDGKDKPGVVVGGKFYAAQKGVAPSVVEKASERLYMADQGIETIDALDKRRLLGIDGDPAADVIAATNTLTQAIGGGVGGESDKKEIREAIVGQGPSAEAARARLRAKLGSIKKGSLAQIGVDPSAQSSTGAFYPPIWQSSQGQQGSSGARTGGLSGAVKSKGKAASTVPASPYMSADELAAVGRDQDKLRAAGAGNIDDYLGRKYGQR
jgi:hypothetical protein